MAQLAKASVVLSLACGASALVAPSSTGSSQVPLKSCGLIASAAEKALKGDRDGVAKLMHEVCAEKSLDAPHRARCDRVTTMVLDSMKVDPATFRNPPPSAEMCTFFWNAVNMSEQQWAAAKAGKAKK